MSDPDSIQGRLRASSPLEKITSSVIYTGLDWLLGRLLWRWNGGVVHGTVPDKAFILAPNHGSYLDWALLDVIFRSRFGRPVVFLAKRKVMDNPIWRGVARKCEPIVFDESARTRAIALAARVMRNGHTGAKPIVCIFPEGTRSRSGEMNGVSPGAAWLARKVDAPMVPVALCGFWEVWPPHRRLPSWKRTGLSVHFLDPVDPADFPDDQTAAEHAMNLAYAVVRRERETRHSKG